MNIYDSLLDTAAVLNEQIARQVFDILPEHGPLVVIVDGHGNCWPSDSEKFAAVNSSNWLKEFASRISDGVEPVITVVGGRVIIGTHLASDRIRCGYIIMIFEDESPETILTKMDVLEIAFNQFSLIAALNDKNNLLYQQHMKLTSLHHPQVCPN